MDAFPRSKVTAPKPSSRTFERQRLSQRLAEAHAQLPRLTLVAAPPGYGKTTAVAHWAAGLPAGELAWISIDAGDNDPLRFLRHLQRALAPAVPLDVELVPVGLELPDSREIAWALALMFEEITHPVALVLDDFHLLLSPFVHEVIDELLACGPAQLHLIILSREDPPVRLSRIRAADRLTEVRAAELAIRDDELDRYLVRHPLDARASQVLHEILGESQGWPVAITLAAQVLADLTDYDQVERALESRRHLVQYFTEEVLSLATPEESEFLISVSILERLEPELCARLSGNDRAGALLEELARRQVFLVPVTTAPPVYRMHALFAAFLRGRLSSGELRELHGRAARLCSSPATALEHARTSEDAETILMTLRSWSRSLLRAGSAGTLRYWLGQFEPEIESDADLSLLRAHLDLLTTGSADTRSLPRSVQLFFEQWTEFQKTDGSPRAELRGNRGTLPASSGLLGPVLNELLESAFEMRAGREARALASGEQATAMCRSLGSPVLEAMSCVWLSHLHYCCQDRSAAQLVLSRAHERAPGRHESPGGHAAYLSLLEIGEIERALASDSAGAGVRDEIARVGQILESAGASFVLPVSPVQWLNEYASESTTAEEHAREPIPDRDVLTPRELDVLRLLATGMRNAQIAEQLFVSVGTVKWHVVHILEKLGATTRTAAVRRARELQLLDDHPL